MYSSRKSSSSSSSEERSPRRSNSLGTHNKRSLVASLTQVIPANNKQNSTIDLPTTSPSEIPFISEETENHSNGSNIPVIEDPALFRPSHGGVNITAVWQNCTMRGWMTKHIPPSYSFTKTKKKRYVVLADRMIYTFKTDQPTAHYREFFQLTKDTSVFVTDFITGAMFCIEVTKLAGEKKSWYLQCQSADHMKLWLDRLKKTVAWLRDVGEGVVTNRDLAMIQTEHDALVNNVVQQQPSLQQQQQQISTDTPSARGTILTTITTASTAIGSSSSSESIISSSSSPLRVSSYYDTSLMDRCAMPDQQDLYYADHYEWDNSAVNNQNGMNVPRYTLSVPVSHHHPNNNNNNYYSSIIPPQQPPPQTAPPPPPLASSPTLSYYQYQQNY
ncbi:hypothetical protein INT45_004171 [Circinella minor]|uniref:PH domain-containing protein n=1 Tax=Circinella minor TaxID=1195481 RepID=A0A8H7RUV6_9FUNG|nr:hypothetical protein INT45_004171 [Circinella minor]